MQTTHPTAPAQQGTTLASVAYAAFYLLHATELHESARQLDALHMKHIRRPVKSVSPDAIWDGFWYVNEKAKAAIASLRDSGALLHYGCPAALEAARVIEDARNAAMIESRAAA